MSKLLSAMPRAREMQDWLWKKTGNLLSKQVNPEYIAILFFKSLPCLSQMIKKTAALPDSESVLFCGLCTVMMGHDHMIHTPPSCDSHMTEWNLISPAAVQMSLHSLAVTFAKEMRSLQLSEEQVTYWNQFMGTRQEHVRR